MNLFGSAFAKYSLIDHKSKDFGVGVSLYPSEIHLVSRVDGREGIGVTELAEEMGITKGAVSQLVSKLVKKGMLSKTPSPENRARVVIRTTERGHIASVNHLEFHRQHDRGFWEYLAELSDEDYAAVVRVGKQMNHWMDAYM
ncbi:MarR family winged helix-turn-helix transcriptional regulator [Pseudodesulfovibrio sp.]|uniref:MarR family winged helix-turn-helix transcriptional regulator n=1 Tax=unclassified Pseudodesulfovibrio TaxID=2661612 RepID=UPI003B002AC5